MIEQTTFLGLPLRTPTQRRLLVVLYYALVLAVVPLALCFPKETLSLGGSLTFVLVTMLGGLRAGGPVKLFTEPRAPISTGLLDGAPITLDLNGQSPRRWGPFPWSPLDEREREQRDRAHFAAYRLLSSGLCIVAGMFYLGMRWAAGWLEHASPLLLWILVVMTLSLPQCVLLWTEPDEPVGELMALQRASR